MRVVLFLGLVLAGLRTGGAGLERNEALLEWVGDLGGGVDGISFRPIPGMGMGAITTRDLEVYMYSASTNM